MKRLPLRGPARIAFHFTVLLLGAFNATDVSAEFKKTTHVYKTVGDVKIQADIHRHDDETIRPVLVWIHGGALIAGSRESLPGNLLELCKADGFVLVSIDYRLAPEVKLPQIAEDLDDALAWIRNQGPKLLHIDPQRMVIAGGSAGGFCTYLVTSRLKQKPRAIVSYWGYGEFDPDWTAVHSKDHGDPVTEADASKGMNHGIVTAPTKEQGQARSLFYRHTRQQGIWSKTVTGFDPAKDQDQLDRFCPVRNITADFPPTLMVHGTIDTDVPYACSLRMAKVFKENNVPHQLVTVENSGHGLSGGDPAKVRQAHETALAFLRTHLQAK